MDPGRIFAYGWRPRVSLEEGIRATYEWYLHNATAADGSFTGRSERVV